MTGHGAKMGRKQEEAIAALITHRTVQEAAKAIQVSYKTLLRWTKNPEFDEAYRAARRDFFNQSMARLLQACPAAVTVLTKVMVDPSAPTSSRVRAAEGIIDRVTHAIEIEGLEARLTRLERASAL